MITTTITVMTTMMMTIWTNSSSAAQTHERGRGERYSVQLHNKRNSIGDRREANTGTNTSSMFTGYLFDTEMRTENFTWFLNDYKPLSSRFLRTEKTEKNISDFITLKKKEILKLFHEWDFFLSVSYLTWKKLVESQNTILKYKICRLTWWCDSAL